MGDLYENNYDDDDVMLESLPSDSQFLNNPQSTGNYSNMGKVRNSQEFAPLSISASEFINKVVPQSGGPSRPPPRINATGGTPGSTGSSGTPGKKPFLRKGSRKEPSALNRIQGRSSPITATESPEQRSGSATQREKPFKQGGFGGSGEIQVLAKPPPPPKARAPTASMMSPPPKINPNNAYYSGDSPGSGSVAVDPNETSGTFEVDWNVLNAKRDESKRQLDEFAVLEQQLEGAHSTLDPFAVSDNVGIDTTSAHPKHSYRGAGAPTPSTGGVLTAIDNVDEDDDENGRYSHDFEPEDDEEDRATRPSTFTRPRPASSSGRPPLPGVGGGGIPPRQGLRNSREGDMGGNRTGMTVAERVRLSIDREQEQRRQAAAAAAEAPLANQHQRAQHLSEERRRLGDEEKQHKHDASMQYEHERHQRERALLGFDDADEEGEEEPNGVNIYTGARINPQSGYERQPYPGEEGYSSGSARDSQEEVRAGARAGVADRLSAAGRLHHQKLQHQQQQRPGVNEHENFGAGATARDRSESPIGARRAGGHRGRGVHGEGQQMSAMLDHSSGPMINRPKSSFSTTTRGGKNSTNNSNNNSNSNSNSNSNNPQRGSQDRPATAGNHRGGRGRDPPPVDAITTQQRELREKAAELEKELITYKTENQKLRNMKKQQEAALEIATKQRVETAKWADEEKKKTEEFCAEQRRIAQKEKRNAAKIASDARRDGLTTSTRKAAADMDVLEATNARLAAEIEANNKKARMTERRLHSVTKEQSGVIDDLKSQIGIMEANHRTMVAYLDRIGVKLPAGISRHSTAAASKSAKAGAGGDSKVGGNGSGGKFASTSGSGKKGTSGTDAWSTRSRVLEEEVVDVPHIHITTAAYSNGNSATTTALVDARDAPQGALSAALFGRRDTEEAVGERHRIGRDKELEQEQEQEQEQELELELEEESGIGSLNRASGVYHPEKYGGKSGSSSTRSSSEGHLLLPHPIYGGSEEEGSSLMAMPMRNSKDSSSNIMNDVNTNSTSSALRASWGARSSGGSSGRRSANRYDENEDEDEDGYGLEGNSEGYDAPGESFALPTSDQVNARASSSSSSSSTSTSTSSSTSNTNTGSASRTEELLPDGRKLVRYRNGTIKEVHPTGGTIVRFVNGDTKTTKLDGTIVYYYCEANTTHTTHTTGVEVYEFPNGQIERHHPDGLKEISFPDRTRKLIYPSGVQESVFPDGTQVKEFPNGDRVVLNSEGHEISTA